MSKLYPLAVLGMALAILGIMYGIYVTATTTECLRAGIQAGWDTGAIKEMCK